MPLFVFQARCRNPIFLDSSALSIATFFRFKPRDPLHPHPHPPPSKRAPPAPDHGGYDSARERAQAHGSSLREERDGRHAPCRPPASSSQGVSLPARAPPPPPPPPPQQQQRRAHAARYYRCPHAGDTQRLPCALCTKVMSLARFVPLHSMRACLHVVHTREDSASLRFVAVLFLGSACQEASNVSKRASLNSLKHKSVRLQPCSANRK